MSNWTLKCLPLAGSCPCSLAWRPYSLLLHLASHSWKLIIHSRSSQRTLSQSLCQEKLPHCGMRMRLHQLTEELTESKLQRILKFMFLETHHPLSNCTQYGKIIEFCKRKKNLDSKLEAGDYWLKGRSSGSNLSVIFTFGLELFAGRNLKCKYFKSIECWERN